MSLGWDVFLAQVGEDVASFFIDLDARPREDGALPYLCRLSISLKSPSKHGLSTPEEDGPLHELEDRLDEYVRTALQGEYVGRYTIAGKRIFYCYLPSNSEIERRLSESLSKQDYPLKFKLEEDPDWERFFEDIFPNPEEHQCILNRRVIERLEESGDTLTTPREVDHWLYFEDDDARRAVKEAARSMGYDVRDETFEDGYDQPYKLQLFRKDPVDPDSIDGIVLELFRLTTDHGGSYDGWETFAVSGEVEI